MAAQGLAVRRANVRFGAKAAVEDVSLSVGPAQVVAVLGPSGCGKSTLLRAVAGLEPLAAGSVSFDGTDLASVPTHRRGFAMMFQDGQLFMHLDVAGNVGYAPRLAGVRGAALAAEVDRLLELVDLGGYAPRRPATLSGGEQQRVALARALAAKPRLLLLDEPLSALDRSLRERLAVDLRGVLRATGTSALLVTHDQGEAFTVADRMAVMFAGRIVQQGPSGEVSRHPADERTARFLGYETVLDGAAVGQVLDLLGKGMPAWGASTVALRRSGLRLDAHGPIEASVTAVAGARDGIHLELEVPGWGRVPAVGAHDEAVGVGDRVRVAIDPGAVALVPGAPPPGASGAGAPGSPGVSASGVGSSGSPGVSM